MPALVCLKSRNANSLVKVDAAPLGYVFATSDHIGGPSMPISPFGSPCGASNPRRGSTPLTCTHLHADLANPGTARRCLIRLSLQSGLTGPIPPFAQECAALGNTFSLTTNEA